MRTDRLRRKTSMAMLVSVLLTLVLPFFTTVAGVTPASVAHASVDSPNSVTIAGDLQHLTPCGGDWQPNCAATHMTKSATDGVWRLSLTLPAGSYNYKAVIDDDWNNGNFGKNAKPGGDNIPLNLAATTAVNFFYDPVTHWVTDDVNSVIVTAAGNFQNEIGCPGDWQPDCLKSWMQDIDGDGVYTYTTPDGIKQTDTDTPATHFEFKAALNQNWTVSYGVGGGSGNVPFDINSSKQYAVLSYNASTHIPTANVKSKVPGQDNNVEYDGLAHDSRNSLYRVPFGVINPGTAVTLRFRTFHNDVTSVVVRIWDTSVGREQKQPMTKVADGVDCYDARLTANGDTCDFWQSSYTPKALANVYYRFIITDGTTTAYYVDNNPRYGGVGLATPDSLNDNGYRINVVDPKFKVIPWMQNGVMYQIFPDRFRNGDEDNDPDPKEPRYDYPAPPNATPQQIQAAKDAQIINKDWNDLPEGYCRNYDPPCAETPKGRDYFGGDLQGVIDKLDYLENLGITIIYFNPIFESGSNHGYDTRDYKTISHFFGDNQTFKELVRKADNHGIRIILDGVFNHMSSDSPFFDRYHHYSTVGACEDANSPYRSWFVFTDVAPGKGVCVDSQNRPNAATYRAWANFDSIPEIVKKDPKDPSKPYGPVADYFYTNPDKSVAGFWLNRGIAGWRFDVMTDPSFPLSYWEQLRTITKGITPNSVIIAEAWHWYDNLPFTEGNTADTAMGYRFRNAVLGLLGAIDDKGFEEEKDPNLPPSTFVKRMESIREDYADATYYTFQNLLDSHDTKRVLWSLTPGKENRQDKEFNAANVAVGKAKLRIASLIQMTVPGTPTIYYGDEVGVTGADDPDDRRTFPWNDLNDDEYDQLQSRDDRDDRDRKNQEKYYGAGGDHRLFDWYQELIDLRQSNPVLRQGKLTFLLADDTNKTLAYAMRKDDRLAIVVINRNETPSQTQTINVPLAGYLRDGVTLRDAFSGARLTTANGKLTVSLGSLQAAVFLMRPEQDITGPAAPTNLTAKANNGKTSTVTLNWNGNKDSASYNVYRSVVQGGGYVKIGNATGTTYTDSTVTNGKLYYYVVRGVDKFGNEGDQSNEASALPAFPIGWAGHLWPESLTVTVNALENQTVYAQVWIDGLTDAAGQGQGVIAQFAYGAVNSDPATWDWQPMSYNTDVGNNDEYKFVFSPEKAGTYQYLARFSTDLGRSWTYASTDKGNRGALTVNPSSDTTAPAAPVNLRVMDFNASKISVAWDTNTDADLFRYEVYRSNTAGGPYTKLANVAKGTTSYDDLSVVTGATYYYVVKAVDTSFNASGNSNEVSGTALRRNVNVTFTVTVPASTDGTGKEVHIAGSFPAPLPQWDPGASNLKLSRVDATHYSITLSLPEGTALEYKYALASWDFVEKDNTCGEVSNRKLTVSYGTNGTQSVNDTVINWRNVSPCGN